MVFQYCGERCLACDTDSVRICGTDANGVIRSLRSDQNSVLAALPSSSTYSQIGRLYSVRVREEFSHPGDFREISVFNPLGSGRIMYVNRVLGGTTLIPGDQNLNYKQAVEILIIRNPNFGDINISPRNLNLGFPDDSVMLATVQNARSGLLVGNMVHTFGLFSLEFAGELIIPPGKSFGVGVFNDFDYGLGDNEKIIVGLTIIWYELDIPT